jgi:hypothetical protein
MGAYCVFMLSEGAPTAPPTNPGGWAIVTSSRVPTLSSP